MERDQRKAGREQCQRRSIPLPALLGARRSAALSQRQLAELAGISPTTVRLLETKERGAYPATVQKLAQALGVPPGDLVRGDPRR